MLHKNIRRDHRGRTAFLYSSQASGSFNHRLHLILRDFARDLADRIGDNLAAIVIGGSYGRGLGRCVQVRNEPGSGVWSIGEAPRDDIDIVLILEQTMSISEPILNAVFRRYAEIMCTPIDLLAIVRRDKLESVPVTASWLELLWAHRVIYGPEEILDQVRARIDGSPNADEALAFHERNGRDIVGSIRLVCGVDKEKQNSDRLDLRRLKSIRYLVDSTLIAASAYRPDPFARIDALNAVLQSETWFENKLLFRYKLPHMYAQTTEAQCRDPQDFASWKEIITLWNELTGFVESKCQSKGQFRELSEILEDAEHFAKIGPDESWLSKSLRYL